MAGFADYERYDALGLADLVRRGKVAPTELLDAAIERVEARNPKVNAVIMPLYDYGRRVIADGLPDGPFRGVPFLLKDLGAPLTGVTMTRGSRFFADTPTVDIRQRERGPAQASRPRDLRAHQQLRGRPLAHLRATALRADPQPVGPE